MVSNDPSRQGHIALVLIVSSSLMAGAGQLLWKLAITKADGYLDIFLQPWLFLGIFLYIIATAFMVLAFRHGDLSVLFPILATSFIWVTILASYLFDSEEINWNRGLGIFMIFLGCCLLGWQQKRNVRSYKIQKQEQQ